MRFSSILLSVAFLFFTNSKVININENGNISESIKNNENVDSIDYIEYKNFHYKFYCIEDANDMCKTVQNNLNTALDYLSDTFEIYNPINFDAYIQSMEENFIAYNTDVNFVPLRTSSDLSNPPYLYPQALAKQLNLNSKVNFKTKDFTLVFNNFKNDPEFLTDTKDSVRTIIHEIIHGLGFMNLGTPDHLNDGKEISDIGATNNIDETSEDASDVKLFPQPQFSYDEAQLRQFNSCEDLNDYVAQSFTGFSPFTIYEKNIVDSHSGRRILEDLGYLYRDFNCIDSTTTDLHDDRLKTTCYDCLSNATKKSLSEIPLKYYMKKDTIGFLTSQGTVIPLQTFENVYNPSSSICHISLDNEKEKEYYSATETDKTMARDLIMKRHEELAQKFSDEKVRDEKCRVKSSKKCAKYLKELDEFEKMIEEEYHELLKSQEMSHIRERYLQENVHYYFNEDFIIYYAGLDDVLSDEFMLESFGDVNRHGLIGNGIVEILKTLGWTEKGESKSDELYYVADEVDYPEQLSYLLDEKYKELDCYTDDEEAPTELPTELPTDILFYEDSESSSEESSKKKRKCVVLSKDIDENEA